MDITQATSKVAKGARVRRLVWGEQSAFYPLIFMVPYLVFFVVFMLWPIFYGLYVSLTKWDLLTPPQFVGLKNYIDVLRDDLFWRSFRNTVLFVALNAPLSIVIPLGLALLVNGPILGRTIFRSAFISPIMISVSTVGILWTWFYNPNFGLINYYLGKLGLPGQNWLSQAGWAMVAIVITTVWWTTGWNLVLFLAGLQDIPEELYEAARIDGAGSWALFQYITLPGLRPTLLFVTVTTVIASFRVFGQVFVMTGGGPFDSTRTLVQHIYETGFRYFRMGEASAVAWLLFCVVAVFTLLQFRVISERQ